MDDLDRAYHRHGLALAGKCKFKERRGVICDLFSECGSCGWNPVVEARRKAKRRGQAQVTRERWTIGSGPFKDGMECHT